MRLLATSQYDIIRKNWAKVMAGDCMTWTEYIAEPEEEQNSFFDWFKAQAQDVISAERTDKALGFTA